MADAEKLFEGVEIPKETQEALLGRVNDFEKTIVKTYESQLADANGKLEEAIKTRQSAKEKAKELEDKIASGQSELKDVLEKLRAENEGLTKSYDELKAEAEAHKKKYTELIENQRAEILATLDGEAKTLGEKLQLTELQEFAKLQAKKKGNVDKTNQFTSGGKTVTKVPNPWEKQT